MFRVSQDDESTGLCLLRIWSSAFQPTCRKGSSIEQVDKYLTENRVEHGLAPDGKTIYGIINWIWGSWIVEVSAQIIIHFRDGKVDSIEVHSIGTFL